MPPNTNNFSLAATNPQELRGGGGVPEAWALKFVHSIAFRSNIFSSFESCAGVGTAHDSVHEKTEGVSSAMKLETI